MFSFDRENTGLVAKWWRNIDKEKLPVNAISTAGGAIRYTNPRK